MERQKENQLHPIDRVKDLYHRDPMLFFALAMLLVFSVVGYKNSKYEPEIIPSSQKYVVESQELGKKTKLIRQWQIGEVFVFKRKLTSLSGSVSYTYEDHYIVEAINSASVVLSLTRKLKDQQIRIEDEEWSLNPFLPPFEEYVLNAGFFRNSFRFSQTHFPIVKGKKITFSYSEKTSGPFQKIVGHCEYKNVEEIENPGWGKVQTLKFACTHGDGAVEYAFYPRLGFWISRRRKLELGLVSYMESSELIGYRPGPSSGILQ